MRYLGSKTSLLERIFEVVYEIYPSGSLCDPFGGIGTVGAYFKSKGYRVITGDILSFAHCFQVSRVMLNEIPQLRNLKQYHGITDVEMYINQLEPQDGWLVTEYARKRMYFTNENARKIQSSINFIWDAKDKNLLSEYEYCFLIASLINSMDLVANTAGTYYAYLKSLTRKALKPFCFSFLHTTQGNASCQSLICNANELIKNYDCDILYLDPPYNSRNYQRYYHLPENIATGCIPKPQGNKSGVYIDMPQASDYNVRSRAKDSFKDLIHNEKYKCLIFHYTDEGLIPIEFIRSTLANIGSVDEFYFDCRAYATKSDVKEAQHHLYRVIRE